MHLKLHESCTLFLTARGKVNLLLVLCGLHTLRYNTLEYRRRGVWTTVFVDFALEMEVSREHVLSVMQDILPDSVRRNCACLQQDDVNFQGGRHEP